MRDTASRKQCDWLTKTQTGGWNSSLHTHAQTYVAIWAGTPPCLHEDTIDLQLVLPPQREDTENGEMKLRFGQKQEYLTRKLK